MELSRLLVAFHEMPAVFVGTAGSLGLAGLITHHHKFLPYNQEVPPGGVPQTEELAESNQACFPSFYSACTESCLRL